MNNKVELREITSIIQGGRQKLSGNDFVEMGFPAYGAGGLNGYLSTYEFDTDAVILSSIGARCGKCFFATGKWSSLANTQIIIPKTDQVDTRFLWFQLNDEHRWIRSGTGQPFIKPSDVKEHFIYLPSLRKQQNIAEFLSRSVHLKQIYRYTRQLSETFLQSIFIKMFGDPARNPQEWDLITLGDRMTFITSGSRGWAKYYADKGALFLRVQNIGANSLLLDDVAFVQQPHSAESRRTRVKSGDLLISATADIGRTGVIPENFPEAYINQHLFLIRLKELDPIFVAGYFSTPNGKAQILKLNREGVKSGLNFNDAKGLTVFNPPFEKQQKFSCVVKKYKRLQAQQREAERQADGLFQVLMDKAFGGEL